MKMKKIIIVFLIVVSFIIPTGCSSEEAVEEVAVENLELPGFKMIPDDNYDNSSAIGVELYYDSETLVIYALVRDGNNSAAVGSFTLLVNSDGTPKLYEEEAY